jgi:hypothetical protein
LPDGLPDTEHIVRETARQAMTDICTYLIQVLGQVDEGEINAGSPLYTTVVSAGTAATGLTICTDQSGLIGLMRHLHGMGFVFLSVNREEIQGAATD